MSKTFLISMMSLLLIIGISSVPSGCTQINEQTIETGATKITLDSLMLQQQNNWNEGNIEGFMQAYWRSDSLQFIGKKGITKGWQATLDRYKISYPDKAAMGRLQFTNLDFRQIDPSHATVVGRWELFRASDTLAGHYTLLWQKQRSNWVIIMDHSS